MPFDPITFRARVIEIEDPQLPGEIIVQRHQIIYAEDRLCSDCSHLVRSEFARAPVCNAFRKDGLRLRPNVNFEGDHQRLPECLAAEIRAAEPILLTKPVYPPEDKITDWEGR